MKLTSPWTKYSYFWVTTMFFLISIIGHWAFAWPSYVNEQEAHGESIEFNDYFIQTSRDTLENWQSEFLQLLWQVAGLSFLFFVGSSQSKESDDRMEAKLDEILKTVDNKNGENTIHKLDAKYARK